MKTGAAGVVLACLMTTACRCPPKSNAGGNVGVPTRRVSRDAGALPSEAERVQVLREVFPLLPLTQPRPVDGAQGATVVPWLQYYVSSGNPDESGAIARALGMREGDVSEEMDDVLERDHEGTLLTRVVIDGLPGAHRVFTFEQFAAHADDSTAIWWTLMLPVLSTSRELAFVSAQLGGARFATDFSWRATKTDGGWALQELPAPK